MKETTLPTPRRSSITTPSEIAPIENKSTLTQCVALYFPWFLPRAKPHHDEYTAPAVVEKGEAAAAQNVFYLAYGSNLCAATFLGRRQIRPISAINVVVPSLALTFDLPGIAYLEPRMANVRYTTETPEAESEDAPLLPGKRAEDGGWTGGLIGVVYEVTPDDYAKILATEGGGSAYQDVTVPAFPLSDPEAEPVAAHTLLAPMSHVNRGEAQPSKRYLDLIRTGAAEHGLPKEYQEWLAGLQHYRRTSLRQWTGAILWGIIWVPVMMTFIVLTKVCADSEGRAPQWLTSAQRVLQKAMWGAYDGGFKAVFGDGEKTEK
jgi:hypothetical protein